MVPLESSERVLQSRRFNITFTFIPNVQYFRQSDKHALFLGEGDLDGGGGGDLEALEGVPRGSRLHLCLKLHKCNVVSSRNQSDLLESRELEKGIFRMRFSFQSSNLFYVHLVEKHAEHHLIGLLWQVGEEEDLVGRSIVHPALTSSPSPRHSSPGLRLLGFLLSFTWGLLGSLLEY